VNCGIRRDRLQEGREDWGRGRRGGDRGPCVCSQAVGLEKNQMFVG